MDYFDRAKHLVKTIILNGRIPLCMRNIVNPNRELYGIRGMLTLSGKHYPFLSYTYTNLRHGEPFIRIDIGLNIKCKESERLALEGYLLALNAVSPYNIIFTVNRENYVHIMTQISIVDTCPTFSQLENAVKNLLALSSQYIDLITLVAHGEIVYTNDSHSDPLLYGIFANANSIIRKPRIKAELTDCIVESDEGYSL